MFRWIFRICALVLVLAVVAFLVVFRSALYNRFIVFPKHARAWEQIATLRQPVALDDGWTEYRGACHNHSELSHDSEVPFPEILAALKEAELDFIFMSDHCTDGKADYSRGWRGDHDGVVFTRGYEMSGGFMPWGLPDDTVLDSGKDLRELAREIDELGGALFFAHTEEERLWDLPELVGMEIYNIHTDFKDESFSDLLPDMIMSLRSYHDHVLRLLFDRQTAILAHWDELNQDRKIVGIAANDAHQNNGYRGYYTDNDTFLLRERGPYDIKEWKLNFLTRSLLRLAFSRLEPGRELFCITLDPYVRSLRFVNTHLLAQAKTEEGLLNALRHGRCFIAFDMVADARGFTYLCESPDGTFVMGDEVGFEPGLVLKAESPLPCRFILIRNGEQETQREGRTFRFEVAEPGNYRLEAELEILDEWTPWVYTNMIYVKKEEAPVASVSP